MTAKYGKRNLDDIWRHIEITNHELGYVQKNVAIVRNDVAWLKKFFWLVATASIGALLAALINMVL